MTTELDRGTIQHRTIDGMSQLEYFVYIPESYRDDGKILYTIHGISRNAAEHVRGFVAQAERHGTVLVGPLFLKENFPRYQRLGTNVQHLVFYPVFRKVVLKFFDMEGPSPQWGRIRTNLQYFHQPLYWPCKL